MENFVPVRVRKLHTKENECLDSIVIQIYPAITISLDSFFMMNPVSWYYQHKKKKKTEISPYFQRNARNSTKNLKKKEKQ